MIEYGANPHLLSKISENEEENALEVACRWCYIDIVRCFLRYNDWSGPELRSACKLARNEEIKQLIEEMIPKECFICKLCKF